MTATHVWATVGCRLLALVLLAQMTFVLWHRWLEELWPTVLLGVAAGMLWRYAEGAGRFMLRGVDDQSETAGDAEAAREASDQVLAAARVLVGAVLTVLGVSVLMEFALAVAFDVPLRDRVVLAQGVLQTVIGAVLAVGWAGLWGSIAAGIGWLRRAGTQTAE